MTIGIAASGSGAAEATLKALVAVETIGQGAIGGFVSMAAIVDGRVRRLETQSGGAISMMGMLPNWVAKAERAALMSSGPNRPTPLSQFTPAEANAGLVTGHRFPNAVGRDGLPMNESVLALMRQGDSAQVAVDRIVAENPSADSGFLALSVGGEIGLADTPFIQGFGDAGAAMLDEADGRVAVVHNAIVPHRGLALMAADAAMEVMRQRQVAQFQIEMPAGVVIEPSDRTALVLEPSGQLRIQTERWHLLVGRQNFGLGYHVPVIGSGHHHAWLAYEPFLVSDDGVLESVDGRAAARLTVSYRVS